MATINMKQARKWANHYGISCQLIAGASETNCKAVIYKDMQFKTSNLTGVGFQELFEKLACGQNVEACSVAKQMVNDAHGRTRSESLKNFLGQDMTYADPFENVQFKGQSLYGVLTQLYDKTYNYTAFGECLTTVEYWVDSMKDIHGADALNKIKEMINSKLTIVYDNHVFNSYMFKKFIDKWVSENGKDEISDDKKMMIIDKYFEMLGA